MRTLRAFAWMRWRVLLNSLQRTGSRDTLERFSLATAALGPIVAALLLVPSLLLMSALSGYAGHALATGTARPATFEVLRFLTLAATGFAVIGPILLPMMDRGNAVRLLLLPIPRAVLYLAQAAGALSDLWTIAILPIVLFLPLGLALGGALQAAALAIVAGLLLLAVMVGLSTLTSLVVQLVVRDRRRGELVALAVLVLLPLISMMPTLLTHKSPGRSLQVEPDAVGERWLVASLTGQLGARLFRLTPSERYVTATRAASEGRSTTSAAALLTLTATTLVLHGCAWLAFQRTLAFPGSVSRRRSTRTAATTGRRVPRLSPGAGAVAVAQIRLALRTSRGRSMLLSSLLMFVVLAVLSLRTSVTPFHALPQSGLGIATLGVFSSILAVLPFAVNQFAVDGAGLTMELLSPLSEEDLLTGKAVANGLMAGIPVVFCVTLAFLLSPAGPAGLWLSLFPAAASIYFLVSPVAAVVSAAFPRVVDLNSVGRSSNAHGLAMLIGMGSMGLAALPPIGLALAASRWLERPWTAPVLLLIWGVATLGANRLLFRAAGGFLVRRRENLALVAGKG